MRRVSGWSAKREAFLWEECVSNRNSLMHAAARSLQKEARLEIEAAR